MSAPTTDRGIWCGGQRIPFTTTPRPDGRLDVAAPGCGPIVAENLDDARDIVRSLFDPAADSPEYR